MIQKLTIPFWISLHPEVYRTYYKMQVLCRLCKMLLLSDSQCCFCCSAMTATRVNVTGVYSVDLYRLCPSYLFYNCYNSKHMDREAPDDPGGYWNYWYYLFHFCFTFIEDSIADKPVYQKNADFFFCFFTIFFFPLWRNAPEYQFSWCWKLIDSVGLSTCNGRAALRPVSWADPEHQEFGIGVAALTQATQLWSWPVSAHLRLQEEITNISLQISCSTFCHQR